MSSFELKFGPHPRPTLSVREARRAQKELDDLWPYVWMNFVLVILLFSELAVACYRVGAQSCH
jgi:hypothetical protein